VQRPNDPVLSILIAVSSRTDLLAECLAALDRHMPGDVPYETIVVLNEIDPAVVQTLESLHPRATFIRSPVNLGMAGSANRARREASGRLLVTLHDDATIEPGWAEALVEAAERHPRAGAIGSKVLFPDGRLQSAGSILWRSGVTTPPWSGQAPDESEIDAARPVDYCGTCALLVRAEVFDAIGGFDETMYPAYFVDVDLGLAVRSQGYYVLCEPKSVIRHHRGASSGDVLKQVAWARNRAYLLRKWATALARQELEPQSGDPDAVSAAILQAASFARDCEAGLARPMAPDTSAVPRPAWADADEVERHCRLSLELHQAIVAQLESLLEARADELARSRRMKVVRINSALLAGRQALAARIRRLAGLRRRVQWPVGDD
jgi:GT2 family glycosyltransferase